MIDDIYSRSMREIDALVAEEKRLGDAFWALEQRLAKQRLDALDISREEFDRISQTRGYLQLQNRAEEANQAFLTASRARATAQETIEETAKQNVRQHVLAHGDEGPEIAYRVIGDVTAVRQEAIDNGVAEFRKIVRRWETADGGVPAPVTYEVGGRGRAYYECLSPKGSGLRRQNREDRQPERSFTKPAMLTTTPTRHISKAT